MLIINYVITKFAVLNKISIKDKRQGEMIATYDDDRIGTRASKNTTEPNHLGYSGIRLTKLHVRVAAFSPSPPAGGKGGRERYYSFEEGLGGVAKAGR